MVGLAEPAAVIEVQGERVVPEDLEGLVVVPIHVTREEVEDGHVHEIQEPPALVVRRQLAHDRAVVGIYERKTIESAYTEKLSILIIQ